MNKDFIDSVFKGFRDCLEWAEYVQIEGDDCGFEGGPIERSDLRRVKSDINKLERFVKNVLPQFNQGDVEAYLEAISGRMGISEDEAAEYFGHDLYLTCSGHGAGFWDRGLRDLGETLSKVCRHNRLEVFAYIHRNRLRISI
jgi:hypothetical protein